MKISDQKDYLFQILCTGYFEIIEITSLVWNESLSRVELYTNFIFTIPSYYSRIRMRVLVKELYYNHSQRSYL